MMALKEYRRIYFLGIGGIGMSAIAKYCLLHKVGVSGYDRSPTVLTDELAAKGAQIIFEDNPELITVKPDLVIYTPAIPHDSLLKDHFVQLGIPMVKRSEALEWITRDMDTIAVAGTHGKTTTSSMISFLLRECGIRHTAILGGVSSNYQSNFIYESDDLAVVEADEYDRSFLRLHPRWVVLTAMDPDHLDIYGTYEEMLNGYRQFLLQIQPGGFLLFRQDLASLIGDEVMNTLDANDVETFSFGLDQGFYQTRKLRVEKGIWHWDLVTPWGTIQDLSLTMPGRHNVLNATAACALVLKMGGQENELKNALPLFKGVSRRFEIRYQDDAHVMIDDYAHHPQELVAAITAAKETYGKEVMGVFQPHLYTRTRDLAEGFAEAMDMLDIPVLIDIYPARELPIEGVSSQLIFDLMRNPNKKLISGDEWVQWVVNQKPEILITLGAGDLDKHIPDLIRQLYKK
jgi:UDP-N-acetylmuramate--alanine ligase